MLAAVRRARAEKGYRACVGNAGAEQSEYAYTQQFCQIRLLFRRPAVETMFSRTDNLQPAPLRRRNFESPR